MDAPTDEDADDELTLDPAHVAAAALDGDMERRLWIRTLVPLIQARSHDSDPSGRVQLAFDLMQIAACERIQRLCNSDLERVTSGQGD
jgi:hypothetical protein